MKVKKNKRSKSYVHKYPYYGFDRNMANMWNYEQYRYWCLCDEGKPKPPSQRETNFMFKYMLNNKKTKRSIFSYLPEKHKKIITEWIAMTKAERKAVRKYEPNAGKIINHWLHQAEDMYWDDIVKAMKF